jgi:hypothetical protein
MTFLIDGILKDSFQHTPSGSPDFEAQTVFVSGFSFFFLSVELER